MKNLTIVKVAVFAATVVYFRNLWQPELPFAINGALIVGCVALMLPVTLVGRRLLDRNPEAVNGITAAVQAMRVLFFGTAIIRAIKSSETWTMGLNLAVPQEIGLAILITTGMALVFTMINLAARGLGAPALASSVKLATDWLYSKMRNPMVLALFLWLLSWGIYLQSGMFLLWVILLVIPVEILFERKYEERELEIRFGESYLEYRAKTPFILPRFALSQFSRKTIVAATGKYLILLILAGSLIITADFAFATNWVEIPFSYGGAYIDTDSVFEQGGIMSFWFLSRKAEKPGTYQDVLTKKDGSWMYQGTHFAMCVRKVEVDMSKKPRETRSSYAVYFDEKGKRIGVENTKSFWVPETGPRLWANIVKWFFAKEGVDTGAVPTIIAFNE